MTDQCSTCRRGTARRATIALVWRLTKGKKYAECRLWTNPRGAELRVEAGGEFVRSEVVRDPLALVDVAMNWKAQFQEKGWIA